MSNGWEPRTRLGRKVAEDEITSMRDAGEIDRSQYRELYDMASGGEFDSVGDVERYVDDNYGEQ